MEIMFTVDIGGNLTGLIIGGFVFFLFVLLLFSGSEKPKK